MVWWAASMVPGEGVAQNDGLAAIEVIDAAVNSLLRSENAPRI
jgi:hypothetical protein